MRPLALFAVLFLLPIAQAEEKKQPDLLTRLKNLKLDKKPFTLFVHLKVKKGQEKALLEAAKPCIEATNKEKGCIAYTLHQDLEDPTKFIFYERFKSGEALKDHLAEAHTKKLLASFAKLLDGNAKVEIYTTGIDK